jgi:hypothetical protein
MYTTESCTFDVKAFWNQFQTLDLFAVKIIYNDNDNYAGTQNCRYYTSIPPITAIHSVYSLLASPSCH